MCDCGTNMATGFHLVQTLSVRQHLLQLSPPPTMQPLMLRQQRLVHNAGDLSAAAHHCSVRTVSHACTHLLAYAGAVLHAQSHFVGRVDPQPLGTILVAASAWSRLSGSEFLHSIMPTNASGSQRIKSTAPCASTAKSRQQLVSPTQTSVGPMAHISRW